ncbi:hypothetical protein FRX31_005158 [Thalictrum thalictroides]|uniref:Uncharacterized protein n=1 Tax=Thalictrum thalictroides TaxID=46969 RepID=A0A7J6X8S0_THATH|nr:hypothetical protein FRX31_005158 [Thalictrum thalictroides]
MKMRRKGLQMRRKISLKKQRKTTECLMQRKIEKLQRIVPECNKMDIEIETVFQKTATYIFFLECQVNVLKNLCDLYEI